MPGLRPFVDGDISTVADLIWKVLHERKGPAPQTLHAHLGELFLRNPWLDEGITSNIFEDSQGKIAGFFGAVPRRMTYQGKVVRLAFGSNFVMDPESRVSMAALQLVKAFVRGTQDISITDSANEMSRQLLRSLGFGVVPIYSMQWARPLRPSRYAIDTISRMKKSRTVARLGSIAKPFGNLADAIAAKASFSPFRRNRLESWTMILMSTRTSSA